MSDDGHDAPVTEEHLDAIARFDAEAGESAVHVPYPALVADPGSVAYAQLRADVAYELLQGSAERSERGGDGRNASLALADAIVMAFRAPAEFHAPPGPDELGALFDRAVSLAPDDPRVAVRLDHAAAMLAEGVMPDSPARLQAIADAAAALGEALVVSPVGLHPVPPRRRRCDRDPGRAWHAPARHLAGCMSE